MKKILVVEDAPSLRKDILEMLGFEGFQAIGAENGVVGVSRAREYLPDLIICDIMMPEMDGYGVLEELRKDARTEAIPFIFLTARTERVDMRLGMELGADDFLTKPFHAAELLATVRTRLRKREVLEKIADDQNNKLRENIMMALPHELRTPLNVILGFSDLLMTDSQLMDADRIGEMSRHINLSALRLYRLIENFLVYTHTELMLSDHQQLQLLQNSYVVYPKSLIDHSASQKAQQNERSNDLELTVRDAEAVGIAEDYLRKIVEELVDNACKFSTAGTPILVSGEVRDKFYVLTISNQGRGMAPEQIALLGAYMQFERRIHEQQGAGLGLIICKRLAEMHGGDLTIESVPDGETTVWVRLPLKEVELHYSEESN
ncbi:MAG: hybrid sensor histidine kinase/response regulator [Chloroflexota bacterium]